MKCGSYFVHIPRIIKESSGEVPARIVMGEVGGIELPCRLPKNNGFDQVFVQKMASGEVEKIFIIESKYNAKGKLHLGKTKNKGLQKGKGNNMSLIKQQAINKSKGIRLVIEPDENVGFYLLVYDLASEKCIQDFLYFPDQLENLYQHAMEYGVNKESFYPIRK